MFADNPANMYLVLGQVRAAWLAATSCTELDNVKRHSLSAQHVHVVPMLEAGGVLFTAKFMNRNSHWQLCDHRGGL